MGYGTEKESGVSEIAALARAGMDPIVMGKEFRDGGMVGYRMADGSIQDRYVAPANSLLRKRRDVVVSTTDSLVNYVREWSEQVGGTPGIEPARHAEAFYTPDQGGRIRVILDARERPWLLGATKYRDHVAEFAAFNQPAIGFDQHQVECALAADTRWAAWVEIQGRWVSPGVLAEFLDERFKDTVDNPDPTDKSHTMSGLELRDLARNFKSTRTQTLHSAIERKTGDVQLSYTNTETKGDTIFTLPDQVFIQLPVYVDGEMVVARVKTAFQIANAAAAFHLQIVDLALIQRKAIGHEVAHLVKEVDWLAGRTYLCTGAAWNEMAPLFKRSLAFDGDE